MNEILEQCLEQLRDLRSTVINLGYQIECTRSHINEIEREIKNCRRGSEGEWILDYDPD